MNLRFSYLSLALIACAALPVFGQVEGALENETDPAEAYRQAAASAESDLKDALEELANLRATIAAEKPSIAKEANQVAADLREHRRAADLARTSRDAAEDEHKKLESDLKAWRDERNYVESLLLDFRKNYESLQSLAQNEAQRDLLADHTLEGRIALLDSAIGRLENAGAIERVPGEALNSEGIVVDGTFIEAGPVSWFLSDDESVSGLVAAGHDLRPELVEGTEDPREIKHLARGEPASPIFDPTLGTAVALAETDSSLLSHVEKGGFWIWPILVLAAIALIAALYKWSQLARIRELRPGVVHAVLEALRRGDSEEATAVAATIRHPARRLLERGIELAGDHRHVPREEVEEALYEKYIAAIPPLQRGLPLIAIASATAPLLGLLGTVTGMIETFRLINIFGTGDAKSLASGISEALVTTEFGLIVAIPALILHALLSRKIQGIRNTMEMTSLAFVNGLPSESPAPIEARKQSSAPVA